MASSQSNDIKKETHYEDDGINISLPTTPIIAPITPTSLSEGVASSSIISSSKSHPLVTTPPSSRSIALMNLQSQLSQLKSSNATLLGNKVLSTTTSTPLVTPPPATLKKDQVIHHNPTCGSPVVIVSQPTTTIATSSSPQTAVIIKKGSKKNEVNKSFEGVLNKGPSKVTKKTPTTTVSQNILRSIPKSTLEAILSALTSPQQLLNTSGSYTYTIASNNQGGSQLVLTPVTTSSIAKTPPTNYGTPPINYATMPTHHVTPPTSVSSFRGVVSTIPQVLSDHHYTTTTVTASSISRPLTIQSPPFPSTLLPPSVPSLPSTSCSTFPSPSLPSSHPSSHPSNNMYP